MRHLLSILCFAVLAVNASAGGWYVRMDGHDGDDGRSWATAQGSISLGIDNCRAGDTLYVAEGIYYESIVLKDGVTIIGGCRISEHGTEGQNTQNGKPGNHWTDGQDTENGRDWKYRTEGKSILDGTGAGTRLISCEKDIVQPCTVTNIVLQNARHKQIGGAAWLRGKVTLRHCVIRGCSGRQCGGVLIKGELPEASALGAVLEDCLIHNCTATGNLWPDAGGVANFDGTLVHCTIANNYGDRYGGIHSESTVTDCTMWGNENEYGFVDPTNYVSDESIRSGANRADEGFEPHFFSQKWLNRDNEASNGPHFRDPATFAGVPIDEAEEAIVLAADYGIGEPTHRIAAMAPSGRAAAVRQARLSFPCTVRIGDKEYNSADYTVPSFMAFLQDHTATLAGYEEPYCEVATINGDPRTQMGFCWFTNEGVTKGEVQLIAKAGATAADFDRQQGGQPSLAARYTATATTTVPLHYAISTSGVLTAANIDKGTAFRYVSHKALADKLTAGTTYSWRVGYEGHWSEIGQFSTAAQEQGEFSFIYMTDSHIQNREYIDAARLCAEAVARNEKTARFCVFPGDFVDTGTERNSEWEWERWFEEVMKPVIGRMPIVPTDGNHDDSPLLNYTYHFNTDTSFNISTKVRPQFAGINYSFVYGDMQLIAFSEQDFWRGEYDYEALTSEYLERDLGGWFRRQVAAEPEVRWRVGLVHKNLFSGSDHQRDKETPLLRATLLPVMKECGMDMVLQGHDHTYEIIGPVDADTRTPILEAISEQMTVPVDEVRNITGKRGGTYDVSRGTLYFIGATCGAKRYTPLTREEMEASKHIHKVENYFDLFTGMFGQPGAPSYTRVTVRQEEIVLQTFIVLPNGETEMLNRIKIVK